MRSAASVNPTLSRRSQLAFLSATRSRFSRILDNSGARARRSLESEQQCLAGQFTPDRFHSKLLRRAKCTLKLPTLQGSN